MYWVRHMSPFFKRNQTPKHSLAPLQEKWVWLTQNNQKLFVSFCFINPRDIFNLMIILHSWCLSNL